MNKNNTLENIDNMTMIGWREWVSLPELGIVRIKAKIDTGARTSALHAYFIEPYHKANKHYVRFGIHPLQGNTNKNMICDSLVSDERTVTDSGGHAETRFVIQTLLVIGNVSRLIEITLTNRDTMKFRMLVGRTAMENDFYVNPALSHCSGKPSL
ncbi:MAG: hypothetical protein ACJAUP_003867 [Cellvibrionaceae bacterium]|jgi:hypothetical protein